MKYSLSPLRLYRRVSMISVLSLSKILSELSMISDTCA